MFLYLAISSFGNTQSLWSVMTNGFILKMKYGFNSYLQLIFKLAHISVLGLVDSVPPLLYAYKFVYRIISLFGRVYLDRKVVQRGN